LYTFAGAAPSYSDSEEQGDTNTTLQTWSASSSYATTIEDSASNSIGIGVSLDVPLDGASLGGSFNFTSTDTSTTGSSYEMNFGQSASGQNETDWLATANSDASNGNNGSFPPFWPNQTQLYLDPRFDTVMFHVPPPAITSVTAAKSGTNTVFTIMDADLTSPPRTALDSGALDVFVCTPGSKTHCVVKQNQVIETDVAGTQVFSTDTVQSGFPTASLPPAIGGKHDFYVVSPGGISAVFKA
jgi:hypothetical protein